MDSNTSVVLSLREAAGRPALEVGGKAANLAVLKEAGFPVPDGFVITTAAFTGFVAANGFNEGTFPETVRAAGLPGHMATELERAIERLGEPVAVRSSGVSEDLAGASYAGQYETVLGVERADAEAALLRCWASAFDRHLVRYHQANGNSGVPEMAVLVQRMLAAEAAGVAFSANPVTGNRGEVVINAVSGLGDRLVAGEVDGEQWLVRSGEAVRTDSSMRALSPDQALVVAGLARDVETHFGAPQDIEWALADGKVHLLQARPVTALPTPQVEIPVEVPEGYWEREASHAPRPWSPLTSSLTYEARNPALRQVMSDFGLLIDAIEFREIGGWEYVRTVPLGGKERPSPPDWLMPIVVRLVPGIRRRVRQAVAAVRSDDAGALVDRWRQEWHPGLKTRIAAVRSVEISTLSDTELIEHYSSAIEVLRDGAKVHFTLHGATCMALAELVFASSELLGWEEFQVWELLAGLSHMSTEPSRRFGELVRKAAARPDTRRIVEEGGGDAVECLGQTDPDFAAALASYLEEFGTRALDYDAATPSLAENPELALGLIADQLATGFDADERAEEVDQARKVAVAQARAALDARPQADQERWERALARAQRAYPVREENVFYTLNAPLGLVRYAALEIGRRLAGRSQMVSADGVFFLHHDEAADALLDGKKRQELVARRRAERAWVETHPGPATYGKDPGPPPPLDALPPEARFANQALLWYAQRLFDFEQSTRRAAGADVCGTAASPGRYQGPVRVIRTEAEFHKLTAGDVLVCPITSPVWSVLFPSIGALVTDTGGILSHPAIIAREHRVPAVVATGNATKRLQDGQIVIVDGTNGLVLPAE